MFTGFIRSISKKEQTKLTSNLNPETTCNLCNFVPKNGNKWILTKHLGKTHFVCSVCEKTLENKKELKIHVKNTHI